MSYSCYHQMDENTCIKFTFGGGKRSKNMFDTQAECESICMKSQNSGEKDLNDIEEEVIIEAQEKKQSSTKPTKVGLDLNPPVCSI